MRHMKNVMQLLDAIGYSAIGRPKPLEPVSSGGVVVGPGSSFFFADAKIRTRLT